MSTKYNTKYKLLIYQNTNCIQITTKEITNISTLTRITCPAQKVRSYVLLPWDVLHPKGVFLDRFRPPEHLVVLVCCVL